MHTSFSRTPPPRLLPPLHLPIPLHTKPVPLLLPSNLTSFLSSLTFPLFWITFRALSLLEQLPPHCPFSLSADDLFSHFIEKKRENLQILCAAHSPTYFCLCLSILSFSLLLWMNCLHLHSWKRPPSSLVN